MSGSKDKARGGWTPLLTPETHDTLVRFVKAGATMEAAASAAGVGRTTFLRWLREAGAIRRRMVADSTYQPIGVDNDYVRLLDAVDQAMAQGEVSDIITISRAASDRQVNGREVAGDWRAAAWKIERRDRSRTMRATDDDENEDELAGTALAMLVQKLDEMASRQTRRVKDAAPQSERTPAQSQRKRKTRGARSPDRK